IHFLLTYLGKKTHKLFNIYPTDSYISGNDVKLEANDSDNTLTPSSSQGSQKDKGEMASTKSGAKDKSKTKRKRKSSSNGSDTTIQEFWSNTVPQSFLDLWSSDGYQVAAAFLMVKKKKLD